ncbi:MAG: hypothetical protein ABSH19_07440, partial [Opitutales bacterium]
MTACALAAALLAFAPSAPGDTPNPAAINSPFINPSLSAPSSAPVNLPPLDLELRGVSRVGDKFEFSFYDVRNRTSFWLTQNTSNQDVQVLGFNPDNNV